jgi:hypothetical protein
MYNQWFLIELPTGENGKKEIVLSSRIGLVLWDNAAKIRGMCEKLSSTNVCYSPLLGARLRGLDSQERGHCL